MLFFMIGYVLVWILLLGYMGIIHNQQNKLKRELAILEELVQER